MKNVKILDCTLRDGGRLFNCEFSDDMINNMISRLDRCKIDIIEIGFLRGEEQVSYEGNSTFFTDTTQIEKFISKDFKAQVIAFIDYGLYDFKKLKDYDGKSISGIRFGFTHKNFIEHRKEVLDCMDIIKKKGYNLFIQNVNTPGYKDSEILDLINICNEKKPYSYGIVDTYGCMYLEDIRHYFDLVDRNLENDIRIDFHSHNNYQLSFALAQEIVTLSEKSGRMLLIDATLNGMGKGAGNLSLEVITDWLIRKKYYDYDFDNLLDIIDDYIKKIKKIKTWGYSVPALISGIYKAHPNNMLYLIDKYDLPLKDIRIILASELPEERERYNYEKLNKLREKYRSTKIDDTNVIEVFKKKFSERPILLIMPGYSIKKNKNNIEKIIRKEHPIIISVNFIYKNKSVDNFAFFGSADRYKNFYDKCLPKQTILSSSIITKKDGCNIVNYEGLVDRINKQFDNSAIMALYFLKKCNAKRILIAGFDGYSEKTANYFNEEEFQTDVSLENYRQINKDIQELFSKFYKSIYQQIEIEFITPSIFHFPTPLT